MNKEPMTPNKPLIALVFLFPIILVLCVTHYTNSSPNPSPSPTPVLKYTYPHHFTGITHDYIIKEALASCKDHQGLHYIVSDMAVEKKRSDPHNSQDVVTEDDYPCHDTYVFHCQDDTNQTFNDGVGYCFISVDQLKDSGF